MSFECCQIDLAVKKIFPFAFMKMLICGSSACGSGASNICSKFTTKVVIKVGLAWRAERGLKRAGRVVGASDFFLFLFFGLENEANSPMQLDQVHAWTDTSCPLTPSRRFSDASICLSSHVRGAHTGAGWPEIELGLIGGDKIRLGG